MKFNVFNRTAKTLGLIAVASTLAGCGQVINEGNFGIERYWGGSYNQEPIEVGWKANFFDTIFEIHGREIQLHVENVRPKDKNSVMLEDLDFTLTYKVNPEKSIGFLLKTADMVKTTEGNYVLGMNVIKKDAQSFVSEVIRKYSSEEILDNKSAVEKDFTQLFQKELDRLYGAQTFEVVETKIANILVARSVEEKIQTIAMVQAENEKNEAIRKIILGRKETMTAEARALKEAADSAGISVDQLLYARMIDAVKESQSPVTITVPVSPSKPKM